MLEKRLEPLSIEKKPGGNQKALKDMWMRLGGCAAITACDIALFFAIHRKIPEMLPQKVAQAIERPWDSDLASIGDDIYVEFSRYMKNYLRPRLQGINTLDLYLDGVGRYYQDLGVGRIHMEGLSGNASYEEYEATVRRQLDEGYPIPYLMLRHKDKGLADFTWHWFWLNGYREDEDGFEVSLVTYGAEFTFSLYRLWNTGFEKKGGLILYKIV